ncbi:unnamed protein product [Rotaria sp. Silwood1]|nr:unnamed protein product [Rotaria sp. Silwood1]
MLIFLIIMFQFTMIQSKQWQYGDCKVVHANLWVEDELNETAIGAENIIRKLVEIEKRILTIEEKNDKFSTYIKDAMKQISSRLPTYYYFNLFQNQNNINQIQFIHLLEENHNAMIFYYNSIFESFNINGFLLHDIKNLMETIREILKDDIICNYQLVLRIYSNNQILFNPINRDLFKGVNLTNASPSVTENVYIMIISEELKNHWQEKKSGHVQST